MSDDIPLVVDLDGSYLRVDTLHELAARKLRSPGALWSAGWAGVRSGKAAMKAALANVTELDVSALPKNVEVAAYVASQAAQGRDVFLATGADRAVADSIVRSDTHFRSAIASDGQTNMTAQRKAEALVDRFGREGFDYIGNSRADLPVWAVARNAIYAGASAPSGALASIKFSEELIDRAPSRTSVWARQLRLHQSAKNALLLLPLIAAHELLNGPLLLRAALGFVAFTAMACAVYLLNDVLDVDADRAHRKKRFRPIAAGWVSPMTALGLGALLSVLGFGTGAILGGGFLAVLLVYAAVTLSYSFALKRIAMIDVITLALLYMIRILAGAVATGIALSFWFTGVTLFLFLSLAFVKRYSELTSHKGDVVVPGRGYRSTDRGVVMSLGVSSGIAALLLLANYIQSPDVVVLYPAPETLWLSIPIVFYWFAHVWLTASRGQMHEDPVVFALKDRPSIFAGLLAAAVFLAASFEQTASVFQLLWG